MCELQPGLQNKREVVRRWKNEEESVEAIKNATMTSNDAAEVLDVKIALEH